MESSRGSKQTSGEWMQILYPNLLVIDPDGWDRENLEESWNEKITKDEFQERFERSTVRPRSGGHIMPLSKRPTGGGDIPPPADPEGSMAMKEEFDPTNQPVEILSLISQLVRERDDAREALAIQYEMYGDPEDLVNRAEAAEAALASCNVQLHNSKQHQLGLMCGELQDKLNRIAEVLEDHGNVEISAGVTKRLKDILG